ncbi:MAG: hypothetical protein EBV03_05320 [Proteobacteria bacterium]|nr:hypothetical protein [Pseudomonadota bacterium]
MDGPPEAVLGGIIGQVVDGQQEISVKPFMLWSSSSAKTAKGAQDVAPGLLRGRAIRRGPRDAAWQGSEILSSAP